MLSLKSESISISTVVTNATTKPLASVANTTKEISQK